jgi:hypothetical protein
VSVRPQAADRLKSNHGPIQGRPFGRLPFQPLQQALYEIPPKREYVKSSKKRDFGAEPYKANNYFPENQRLFSGGEPSQ